MTLFFCTVFVTHNNKDHDGHGPEFLGWADRINKKFGTNITVYHNFHDEVDYYRTHWWQCDVKSITFIRIIRPIVSFIIIFIFKGAMQI